MIVQTVFVIPLDTVNETLAVSTGKGAHMRKLEKYCIVTKHNKVICPTLLFCFFFAIYRNTKELGQLSLVQYLSRSKTEVKKLLNDLLLQRSKFSYIA